MGRIWVAAFILFLGVLFLLSEILLPRIAAEVIAVELKEELVSYRYLAVEVKSRPALKLLQGKIDRLIIEGNSIIVEDLEIEELVTVLEGLRIVRKDEVWDLQGGAMTGLRMVVTQESLNAYKDFWLGSHVAMAIVLEPGLAQLHGPMHIFNRNIDVSVEGTIHIEGGRYLVFRPRRLVLEEIQLPGAMVSSMIEEMNIRLDMRILPIPFRAEEVMVGEGKVTLLTVY